MIRSFLSKVMRVSGTVIQYACITHCTFEYLADFVICSGPSMEPTLYSENILLTDRISPRLHKYERGDIVIARCLNNPEQLVCKRIIALPGDTIILNTRLNESVKEIDPTIYSMKDNRMIIPRGHVWIEGDNSPNSSDSRTYGPIPQGLIRSKVLCRIWPLKDIRWLS